MLPNRPLDEPSAKDGGLRNCTMLFVHHDHHVKVVVGTHLLHVVEDQVHALVLDRPSTDLRTALEFGTGVRLTLPGFEIGGVVLLSETGTRRELETARI